MTAFALLACSATAAAAEEPIRIKVLGGLAGISQYNEFEEPFWLQRIPELSKGRLQAAIHPFDRSGLRGQDVLQLMRLGVVPFGTAIVSVVAADEPEFNAVDLPVLNPDMASLRRTVGLYRPLLEKLLRDRYDIALLGIYAYPAQVIYCAKPFSGLDDLKGRRVRTSSVGQSEMMAALEAIPVITPFAETVRAVTTGVVDCAITGTMSGNAIGLAKVTTHIHTMAISWGISFFGANIGAWNALPDDLRGIVQGGIEDLERRIWDATDQETADGLACNAGLPACRKGARAGMTVIPASAADEARRRRLLTETVLPGWIARCGADCAKAWNETLAPSLGISAKVE